MANELVLIYETHPAIPMTCDESTGIEKGTAVKVTDPAIVSATSADGDKFMGVTKTEKIANDGRTKVAVLLGGIFRVKDSGAGVTVGDNLKINGANLFATADEAGAQGNAEYAGKALETAGAGETFLAKLGVL